MAEGDSLVGGTSYHGALTAHLLTINYYHLKITVAATPIQL
jgi:hypothetical protein